MINRRRFVKTGVARGGMVASGSFTFGKPKLEVPSYLKKHEELYAKDPRQAASTWFQEARFGLFLHYGLYSLLEGHHRGSDEIMEMLTRAKEMPANLLLNTGPLPDGSIHPQDVKTLKEVGRRLRKQ